ncbi:MAG: hypothetical protein ABI609_11080 [Acidobacteriota bacterium]
MPEAAESELANRLRGADRDALAALLRELIETIDVESARHALRNPFLEAPEIVLLFDEVRLRRSYDFQRDVALHPRTPEPLALRLVATLFWRDLARLGLDTRVRPVVRRAADQRLIERLAALAVGERVAIAHLASPAVLQRLRHDGNPRVLAALLENPRLTEATLLPIASSETVPPAVLEVLAKDQRFGARYVVRQTLSRNPRLPVQAALSNLVGLRKVDLAAVASDPRIPSLVRQRARLLLGELR